jgi:hypothetical protein
MARVVLVDNAIKVPNRSGPPFADVYALWVENPGGLDVVMYQSRIPKGVLAHDHGERRGYPLEHLPLGGCLFGPQGTPGGAPEAWEQGIPLYPPSSALITFVPTPKPVAWVPLYIPGGVKTLYVETLFYLDGAGDPREVTLAAKIRPVADIGLDVGAGPGPTVTLVHTVTGAVRETRGAFHFPSLASLGQEGLDREDLVVEIFLASNPPAGTTYRLLGAFPFVGSVSTASPPAEPLEHAPEKAEINPDQLRAGQLLEAELGLRAHLRWNQTTLSALGEVPGLKPDLSTPEETRPWRQVVRGPHKHTGRVSTHPVTGERLADGAVPRRIAWAQFYGIDFNDTAAAMGEDYPLGEEIDGAQFDARLDVPVGLSRLDFVFALSAGHDEQLARLNLDLRLVDLDDNNIDIEVATGAEVSLPSLITPSFTRVRVDPRDGAVWKRASERVGRGLWTNAALRHPSSIFAGFSQETSERIPRVSERVRFAFTAPRTGPLRLIFRFGLELGAEGSATFATEARLAWAAVTYPPGF